MKKSILAALALLTLTGCATRLPEEELRLTRERLDKYLCNEESLTQSEMTILSEYLLRLARMEQYMIEYRVWNQPGYDKIEKQDKYAYRDYGLCTCGTYPERTAFGIIAPERCYRRYKETEKSHLESAIDNIEAGITVFYAFNILI